MKDLWVATTFQCHLQGIETELRVKAVHVLPAELVSGEQIHDRPQVKESFPQQDDNDIGRPALVRCPDLLEVHKTGESLAWHGAGFL